MKVMKTQLKLNFKFDQESKWELKLELKFFQSQTKSQTTKIEI